MDNRDNLRSMLNNLINDKAEEASLDLHNYLTTKMKEVAGISTASVNTSNDDDDDESTTDEVDVGDDSLNDET